MTINQIAEFAKKDSRTPKFQISFIDCYKPEYLDRLDPTLRFIVTEKRDEPTKKYFEKTQPISVSDYLSSSDYQSLSEKEQTATLWNIVFSSVFGKKWLLV